MVECGSAYNFRSAASLLHTDAHILLPRGTEIGIVPAEAATGPSLDSDHDHSSRTRWTASAPFDTTLTCPRKGRLSWPEPVVQYERSLPTLRPACPM